jgi:hypothetical protein
MTDATDDMDNRPFIQNAIRRWDEHDTKRAKRSHEIRSRIEQMQAHLDEGGKFGDEIKQELMGYIKELS